MTDKAESEIGRGTIGLAPLDENNSRGSNAAPAPHRSPEF